MRGKRFCVPHAKCCAHLCTHLVRVDGAVLRLVELTPVLPFGHLEVCGQRGEQEQAGERQAREGHAAHEAPATVHTTTLRRAFGAGEYGTPVMPTADAHARKPGASPLERAHSGRRPAATSSSLKLGLEQAVRWSEHLLKGQVRRDRNPAPTARHKSYNSFIVGAEASPVAYLGRRGRGRGLQTLARAPRCLQQLDHNGRSRWRGGVRACLRDGSAPLGASSGAALQARR